MNLLKIFKKHKILLRKHKFDQNWILRDYTLFYFNKTTRELYIKVEDIVQTSMRVEDV